VIWSLAVDQRVWLPTADDAPLRARPLQYVLVSDDFRTALDADVWG